MWRTQWSCGDLMASHSKSPAQLTTGGRIVRTCPLIQRAKQRWKGTAWKFAIRTKAINCTSNSTQFWKKTPRVIEGYKAELIGLCTLHWACASQNWRFRWLVLAKRKYAPT